MLIGFDPDRSLLLLGLTRENVELLTGGRPIRLTRQSHGPAIPEDLTVALVYGDESEDILALLKSAMPELEPVPMPPELAEKLGVGPTGEYPYGPLSEDDEGELRAAAAVVGDTIRIEFGKKVAWLALHRAEAEGMIATLQQLLAKLPE